MPTHQPYNENELLLRIAAGDEHSFDAIVRIYWKRLYSVALAYTGTPVLAEDIIQDVFMNLWIKRDTLASINSLKDYLFTMTKYRVLRILRSLQTHSPVNDYLETAIPGQGLSPDDAVAYKQLSQYLSQAIETLPPQQKKAFKLSREAGLDHESIAKEMNISVNTVKNHIVTALNTLKNYLYNHKDLLISIFFLILTSRYT